MAFRRFDSLRLFNMVARFDSFAAAAEALNMTKGAISQQMKALEGELGFAVFHRRPRGIDLTPEGAALRETTARAFGSIEERIESLRSKESRAVTIGLSTYLASRWLSPRLMEFMRAHPDIRLRLQPMVDLLDLKGQGVDLAIRWGDGNWDDMVIKPLFACPAFPTGSPAAMEAVRALGERAAFDRFTLLHDRPGSMAWADWFSIADIPYVEQSDTLTVPDPNVRVQAVIDGQGVALNDALIDQEVQDGRLVRLSDFALDDYGYHLAYTQDALNNPDVADLVEWLSAQKL